MLDLSNFFKLLEKKGVAAEISKATGISTGNISDWKKGRSKPTTEAIVKIANYFDYSVDFLLDRTPIKEINLPLNDIIYLQVCEQKASAGIGKIEDESNPDLSIVCFKSTVVPRGTTHGIIIEGRSMEKKFFNNQIVFIEAGVQCAPSEYGIFSVTDSIKTKIYCKQLMQRSDGTQYLHSVNTKEGDPDINYKDLIDIHCIGKILV